jgi:hypothetical protein
MSNCPGVLFTCGCYTLQLEGRDGEGYGFAAMRNPGGPVAIIGASSESYGVMGHLAFDGLLSCLDDPQPPSRLGDYWLAVKNGIGRGPMNPVTFFLYDQVDGSVGETSLPDQRLEHLDMWTLLGDPALRFPFPTQHVTLDAAKAVRPGESFAVAGDVPAFLNDAAIYLTLERPLGLGTMDAAPPPEAPRDSKASTSPWPSADSKNPFVIVSKELQAESGRFECRMTAPEDLVADKIILRAHAIRGQRSAMGVLTLPVDRSSGQHDDGTQAKIENRPDVNVEQTL